MWHALRKVSTVQCIMVLPVACLLRCGIQNSWCVGGHHIYTFSGEKPLGIKLKHRILLSGCFVGEHQNQEKCNWNYCSCKSVECSRGNTLSVVFSLTKPSWFILLQVQIPVFSWCCFGLGGEQLGCRPTTCSSFLKHRNQNQTKTPL